MTEALLAWIEEHSDDARCCVCDRAWRLGPHHRAAKAWCRRHGVDPDTPDNLCWMCTDCHARVTDAFGPNLGTRPPTRPGVLARFVGYAVRLVKEHARYVHAFPAWLVKLVVEEISP